ncbi:MAG: ribonuclease E/G [Candidatus Jordarchaeales archaeon]|nr:ribonuclease E/G [Candidatus Jordarchaeia archaeon]
MGEEIQIRVRGIYATALSKLFLEHGFSITQSSAILAERLKIERTMNPPNVEVYDTKNRQGVIITGEREPLGKVVSVIREGLEDVIIRKAEANLNAIYVGRIIKKYDEKAIADIGCLKVPVNEKAREEGEVQLLRVYEVDPRPQATGEIAIAGKYVVLTFGGHIGISNKIRNREVRDILYHLGNKMKPAGMGVIFRTAAGKADLSLIAKEIEELEEEMRRILDISADLDEPTLVREGDETVIAEFPASIKRQLDNIRERVAPTINGHHYYKALGSDVAQIVDFAEELISRHPELREEASQLLQKMVIDNAFKNDEVRFEHVKLNGKVILLHGKLLQKRDHQEMIIKRSFTAGGYYDGLNIPKEAGDYGITQVKVGEWTFKTEYYSKKGELKGTFYNINTPIELYPNRIRYIDLEIDVIQFPNGTVKIIDKNALEEAFIKGYITEKLKRKAERVAELIAEKTVANIKS